MSDKTLTDRLQADVAFYQRVLIQACLSNGGKIDVDPGKAPLAMDGTFTLEFGNGKVTLLGSEHSLFPNPEHDTRVHGT